MPKNVVRVIVVMVLLYSVMNVYNRYQANDSIEDQIVRIEKNHKLKPNASDGKPAYRTVGGEALTRAEFDDFEAKLDLQNNGPDLTQVVEKINYYKQTNKVKINRENILINHKYDEFIKHLGVDIQVPDFTNEIIRSPGESPRAYKKRLLTEDINTNNNKKYLMEFIKKYTEYRREVDLQSNIIKNQLLSFEYCKKEYTDACSNIPGWRVERCNINIKCIDPLALVRNPIKKPVSENSYITHINKILLEIDLIGDINKLDYAINSESHLTRAAKSNDVIRIKTELMKGADINGIGTIDDITPLFSAVTAGAKESVELLLESGANINAINVRGETPLFYAVNNTDMFKLLLSKGADVEHKNNHGRTVLYHVLGNTLHNKSVAENELYQLKMIKLVLKSGAIVDARDNNEITPFLFSIDKSSISVIQELIKHNANVLAVNRENYNAMYYALSRSSINNSRSGSDERERTYKLLSLLVNNGLSINSMSTRNKYGTATLLMALNHNNDSAVSFLLDNGVDVNVTSTNTYLGPQSALYVAFTRNDEALALRIINNSGFDSSIRHHQEKIINFAAKGMYLAANALLDKGLDINIQNKHGTTPLMAAVEYGHVKYTKELLLRGANKEIINNNGKKAIDLAAEIGNAELIAMLR